jgi:hypothetical protein
VVQLIAETLENVDHNVDAAIKLLEELQLSKNAAEAAAASHEAAAASEHHAQAQAQTAKGENKSAQGVSTRTTLYQ